MHEPRVASWSESSEEGWRVGLPPTGDTPTHYDEIDPGGVTASVGTDGSLTLFREGHEGLAVYFAPGRWVFIQRKQTWGTGRG